MRYFRVRARPPFTTLGGLVRSRCLFGRWWRQTSTDMAPSSGALGVAPPSSSRTITSSGIGNTHTDTFGARRSPRDIGPGRYDCRRGSTNLTMRPWTGRRSFFVTGALGSVPRHFGRIFRRISRALPVAPKGRDHAQPETAARSTDGPFARRRSNNRLGFAGMGEDQPLSHHRLS